MKTVFLSTAAMLVLAFGFTVTARGQEAAAPSTTVWDKVYTADQATRGKDAYMTECSACHSEDLGGSGYAPALKGNDFAFAWNDKTVGDFFERIRKLMPPDNPGSLTPDRYRDVIAFVLQQNKYPEGDHELSSDAAALKQIKITAKQ
jgi:polar amino acid transport system substrate-binding protein